MSARQARTARRRKAEQAIERKRVLTTADILKMFYEAFRREIPSVFAPSLRNRMAHL